MVTWTPKFLVGLAFATFGATNLVLFIWDAWARGRDRLAEQLAPERLALLAMCAVTIAFGVWLIRYAYRTYKKGDEI